MGGKQTELNRGHVERRGFEQRDLLTTDILQPWRCRANRVPLSPGPITRDRESDKWRSDAEGSVPPRSYETEGHRFESCRARFTSRSKGPRRARSGVAPLLDYAEVPWETCVNYEEP